MTVFIGLLRAVNVGGRKLAMADLKAIAEQLGFEKPRTFIASGNLLFASSKKESDVSRLLEDRLREHMGAEVPVMVRTASEIADVSKANPFADKPPSKVAAIFFEKAPPKDIVEQARGIDDEELALRCDDVSRLRYVGVGARRGWSLQRDCLRRRSTATA